MKIKPIEISYENITACIETFLRATKVIPEDMDVYMLDIDIPLNDNDMVELDILYDSE